MRPHCHATASRVGWISRPDVGAKGRGEMVGDLIALNGNTVTQSPNPK